MVGLLSAGVEYQSAHAEHAVGIVSGNWINGDGIHESGGNIAFRVNTFDEESTQLVHDDRVSAGRGRLLGIIECHQGDAWAIQWIAVLASLDRVCG